MQKGDIYVGGDVDVVQSMALQPEDFHLPLDAGVGVMVPVVGQGPPIVWAEKVMIRMTGPLGTVLR